MNTRPRPLYPDWVEWVDSAGRLCYGNIKTKESSWIRPEISYEVYYWWCTKHPLPPDWVEVIGQNGSVFYGNNKTGCTMNTRPRPLYPDWVEWVDSARRLCYGNIKTKESSWIRPEISLEEYLQQWMQYMQSTGQKF